MAKSDEELMDGMKNGLMARTGQPLEHWVALVQASGLDKFSDQMALLKTAHGIGHGHASFICQAAKGRFEADPNDMLDGQYKGKEALRPLYEAIAHYAAGLGPDVGIDPGKTAVSLRRNKKFANVVPASKTRIDLGLNLKGHPGTDRLLPEKPGAMCTHKVKLESTGDFDAEVKAWMKEAYGKA
jgi:predicted transport protein